MLSQVEIERVRAEHRIVDVLARAGVVVPAGRDSQRYVMIACPLRGHNDSTPSMLIQPGRDRYHCFGCGAGGDVLQLVMDLEGVRSLTAAAEVLDAGRPIRSFPTTPGPASGQRRGRRELDRARTTGRPDVGVGCGDLSAAATNPRCDVVKAPDRERTSAERILEVSEAAWRYLTLPPRAGRARAYLAGRGIDLEALEQEAGRPLAGHTPDSPNGIGEHLLRLGFACDELVDAGWLARWPSGRVLDHFRRRVLLPARDAQDRVVGAYGRVVTGRSSARYLNTPETVAFHKGELLYRPTRAVLCQVGHAVVCEGTLDALAIAASAASADWSKLVAPVAISGTALTVAQAGEVAGICPRPPVLCGDGDAAGRAAMAQWAISICRLGRECLVTVLPDGQDPAEWLHRLGSRGLLAFFAGGADRSPANGDGPVPVASGGLVADSIHRELSRVGLGGGALERGIARRLRMFAAGLQDVGARTRFARSSADALAALGLGSAAAIGQRLAALPPRGRNLVHPEAGEWQRWEDIEAARRDPGCEVTR